MKTILETDRLLLREFVSLAFLFYVLAFLLLLIFRRPWLAVAVFILGAGFLLSDASLVHWFISVLVLVALLVVLMRCDVLTLTVALYFWQLLNNMPITYDLSAWYARQGVLAVLILAGLTVYGFLVSLGRRPLFRDAFFQES